MKLGLVGLPQVGKKTLFRLLTGQLPARENCRTTGLGLARVRDGRFDRLVSMYEPRKITPAEMIFSLLPDLEGQAEQDADVFKEIERVDVVCYLARVFEDDTVFHVEGSVDPSRDIRAFAEELLLADQIFVEKRLQRIEKEKKHKDPQRADAEIALLSRMIGHLESGRPLRSLALSADESRLVGSYPFVSNKAVVVVLNVGEEQVPNPGLVEAFEDEFKEQAFEWIAVSAKIEEEVSQLDPPSRDVFLNELGIDQPALDRLTLLCYETLGLLSFFTVGEDEVRAWTIRKGTRAPRAGGAIHGDIERGFIRAETIAYEDLMGLGGEQNVKAAGKLVQKGKEAEILDGDVIHFLFKV